MTLYVGALLDITKYYKENICPSLNQFTGKCPRIIERHSLKLPECSGMEVSFDGIPLGRARSPACSPVFL